MLLVAPDMSAIFRSAVFAIGALAPLVAIGPMPPLPQPPSIPPEFHISLDPEPYLPRRDLPCVCFDGVVERFNRKYLHFMILNDTGQRFSISVSDEGGPQFIAERSVDDRWELQADFRPRPERSRTLEPTESVGFLVPLPDPPAPVRARTSVLRVTDGLTAAASSKIIYPDMY